MILGFDHEENARGCHPTSCVPGKRIIAQVDFGRSLWGARATTLRSLTPALDLTRCEEMPRSHRLLVANLNDLTRTDLL